MVVQDRQFRIKGLTASPGGSPNPAKLSVNSALPLDPKANSNTKANTDTNSASRTSNNKSNGNSDNIVKVDKSTSSENDNRNGNVQATGARSAALPNAHLLPQFIALLAIVLSTIIGVSLC
jgi:hypothetical protein